MESKYRKFVSVVSTMAILLVSILVVFPFPVAAEQGSESVEIFTNTNGFNIWNNPASWNYTITENPWKFVRGSDNTMLELRYDTNRYGNPISLDLNKTPVIFYDVEMNGAFSINMVVDGAVNTIKLVTGSGKGSYDLRRNPEVVAAAKNGVITISTVKMDFAGSVTGSYMTLNALQASSAPMPEEQPLFTNKNGFHIWNNPASWNYTITENPWKFVRGADNTMLELRYDTNRYGDPVSIDLNKTPFISYNVEMDGAFSINLVVDGVGKDITIVTGSGKGSYDLRENAQVVAAAKYGMITISTVKMEFTGSVEGSYMTLNAFQTSASPMPKEQPVFTDMDGFHIWNNPANWNYTIIEKPWQFVHKGNTSQNQLRYDTNRFGDRTPTPVDLSKTPYLVYDMQMSGDFEVWITFSGIERLKCVVGSQTDYVNLTTVPAIADYMKAHGNILQAETVYIEFTNASKEDYMRVDRFSFAPDVPQDILDAKKAAAVDQMITNLGKSEDLTLDNQAAVEATRAAYNALNAVQRNLVTKLANLEACEDKIDELIFHSQEEASKAVTYYVDSVNGSSSNSGLSEKTPVKRLADVPHSKLTPGSKVLLKAGSLFKEQLILTASGKKGAPIVYDMYGYGPKPIIDGQGEMSTVYIAGVQYLEMRNLQICSSQTGHVYKRGIWACSNGVSGALNHLYFQNLDIHNMTYNGLSGVNRASAGIYVDNDGEANKPNYYNDVRIEGCHIYDVSSCGIIFTSQYGKRNETPSWNLQPLPYTPATNVIIRNNIIHDLPGDGIWLSTSKEAKIEHNVVYKTGDGTNTAYAGMWPHNSDGCVMQYNEAYGNYLGGGDGQGMDVDINCNNTIVQYNYSHDNEGGFLLICSDSVTENYNRGTVVRYNISQNDLSALFSVKGVEITGLKVHNNTFYTNKGYDTDTISCLLWTDRNNAEFKNNIFVNESSMAEGEKGKLRFVSNKDGSGNPMDNNIVKMKFENNLFAGKSPVHAPKAEYQITVGSSNKNGVDPGLVNPGAGKIGRSSADCYKLKPGSVCRGTGVAITDNGGKDFFGNKISGNTSIGAHQG